MTFPTAKRERVFERDKRRCVRCNSARTTLSVHHLTPRANGGGEALDNLVTLCDPCHDWVECNLGDFPELRTRPGIIGSYPSGLLPAKASEAGAGYPLPEDKADIWALWVKQGRRGAAKLNAAYGARLKPTKRYKQPAAKRPQDKPNPHDVVRIPAGPKNPANYCVSCGHDFASLLAFDRHRRGRHDRTRCCLTEKQMTAAGMEKDPRGRWRLTLDADGRARLAALEAA